jgi:phosphate transport system permease protein
MRGFWRNGESFIWLTGAALAFCLMMIGGMVAVILYHGAGVFWPEDLVLLRLKSGEQILGQVVDRQEIPHQPAGHRLQLKVGNRDAYGLDFRWVDEAEIAQCERPVDAVVCERTEWGDFIGFVAGVRRGEIQVAGGGDEGWQALQPLLEESRGLTARIRQQERQVIGELNIRLERLRLEIRRLEQQGNRAADLDRLQTEQGRLWAEYEAQVETLDDWRGQAQVPVVTAVLAGGAERQLPVADIVRAYRPNRMGVWDKTWLYLARSWAFVSGEPRESNTEGGIFPAIFGTVMMVMLMSLAAVPFGILAALYLREYARQGALVRLIRIAVNNLAGVPSIVFGMFGLGFFVYGLGSAIDWLFYAESLPSPTFGTGGILWASLTLALMTVPVVIVSTEEALAAVPREIREGALALGSTKFQMVWSVVLPGALPGILTGIILATARGAGEVAPLMITGVVKLAPDLPLDGHWPFFHLERKFMHLGFHIYDVGFQSPNVEAARPMVYTTALLLLLLVLLLNLTAIVVRNRLRRRYAAPTF